MKWVAGRGGSGRASEIRGRVEGLFEMPGQPWMGFGLMDSTVQVAFQEVILTTGCRTSGRETGTEGSKEPGEVTVESGSMRRGRSWVGFGRKNGPQSLMD